MQQERQEQKHQHQHQRKQNTDNGALNYSDRRADFKNEQSTTTVAASDDGEDGSAGFFDNGNRIALIGLVAV